MHRASVYGPLSSATPSLPEVLLFIVIGAASLLDIIIGFSDAMIFAMSIPNLIGVYLLMGVVARELTQYEDDLRTGVVAKVDV